MDEHWLDEKDEKGNYLNFEPFFDPKFDSWMLSSKKTKNNYFPSHLFGGYAMTKKKSHFDGIYVDLSEKLDESLSYKMTPVFMFHWLKTLLLHEAMEYREDKRLQFLNENMLPGLNSKEVGKVHKKSEKLYQDSYFEFFERFKDF